MDQRLDRLTRAAAPAALRSALAAARAQESARWLLWLPVGFGLGIAGYFALPVEPPLALMGLGFLALVAARALCPPGWAALSTGALVAAGGAVWATLATALVAAPVVDRPVSAGLEAVLVSQDPGADGAVRMVLAIRGFGGPGPVPAKVRLQVRTEIAPGLVPGDRVTLRARLTPPPGPVMPGDYDFARRAYFERWGAVGYALSPVARQDGGPAGLGAGWAARVQALRESAAARFRGAQGSEAGAVAAALMTGLRGAIPERVAEDLRVAGLAHLLAISGLHVGLVAACLFFAVRAGLAAVPRLALVLPIKALAALGAWLGAGGYVLLAGLTVPTQRAFIMVTLALAALLLGRRPISLRLVAVAALAVLVLQPAALVSAGFQMSFAAALALTAAYEALAPRFARERRGGGLVRTVSLFFLGILFSTLVAEAAIAPFAAYHFQRFGLYGPVANLVAMPLMSLWIMPLGLISLLLMPLGLEGVAIVPMRWGIELVLATAEAVAAWPGAEWPLRAFGPTALLCFALAGLMVLLLAGRWVKLLAPAVAGFGLWLVAQAPQPDLIVDGRGERIALARDGRLWVQPLRGGDYERTRWRRRLGLPVGPRARDGPLDQAAGIACDPLGCGLTRGDRRYALLLSAEAALEDCRPGTVLIALTPVPDRCPADRVIDRFDLLANGVYAIDTRTGAVRTTQGARGRRPWSERPARR